MQQKSRRENHSYGGIAMGGFLFSNEACHSRRLGLVDRKVKLFATAEAYFAQPYVDLTVVLGLRVIFNRSSEDYLEPT